MPGRAAALLLPVVLAAGCGAGGEADRTRDVVPDSIYVEVMARLVLLDSVMTSPADHPRTEIPHDSLRVRILRRWGVSGDELLEYARQRGTRPGEMQELWTRVRDLSDSLRSGEWSPPSLAADTTAAADTTPADTARADTTAGADSLPAAARSGT